MAKIAKLIKNEDTDKIRPILVSPLEADMDELLGSTYTTSFWVK